jgi:hypothetical protein
MTTHSQRPSVGNSLGASNQEHLFVSCPICQKQMRMLTITHLRVHEITVEVFRQRFPKALFESPASSAARTKKSSSRQAERLRSDPSFLAEKKRQGQRLAAVRAALSSEQNASIQRQSVATFLQRTTAEERSAQGIAARAIALAKHPDLSARGGAASAAWKRLPENRRKAAERFRRMWQSRGHRSRIATANSRAAIDGRIPVIFRRARPTTRERKMISLLRGWGIPLLYVGDGSFRVPTPGGLRHWRNPDFINEAARKILLLDLFRTAHADVETADYLQAGWQVLRVKTDEMRDAETLERKVHAFMAGV